MKYLVGLKEGGRDGGADSVEEEAKKCINICEIKWRRTFGWHREI